MKKVFQLALVLSTLTLGISACSNKSESSDKVESSKQLADTTKIQEPDNKFDKTSKNLHDISARGIVRRSLPFSIVDPFHGHRTNQIPMYKTDLKVSLKEDGSVSAYRERVQYGWSQQGVILDSIVYKDEFSGKWLKTERLSSAKQTVYQIKLDNCGYVWYWPENSDKIYAKSSDNWEDMINNDPRGAFDVLSY